MPFAVWITGLPGSGKSTIAGELVKNLGDAEYMRLDELRKKYVAKPIFTDEERESVYTKFIEDGVDRVRRGRNVIYDATAHKKKWRDAARSNIKDFLEVYVKCSVKSCIERESGRGGGLVQAELYRKALERKRTGKNFKDLGKVAGVDVPYEENRSAEIIIDSEKVGPEEAARIITEEIKRRGWA